MALHPVSNAAGSASTFPRRSISFSDVHPLNAADPMETDASSYLVTDSKAAAFSNAPAPMEPTLAVRITERIPAPSKHPSLIPAESTMMSAPMSDSPWTVLSASLMTLYAVPMNVYVPRFSTPETSSS